MTASSYAPRDANNVPAALFENSSSPGTVLAGQIDQSTGRILTTSAGGSGTVTSVSVVTANGFAGTVANATTTPAITLTTTINAPVLAGNGTAIAGATTTGSGSTVVLQDTPTLTTPVLGVATATSINKVAFTAPAAAATLTIANNKTLTANASITLAGTDGKTLTVSNSGTLAGGDAFVLAIAAGKTLTVSNTLTFTGTDSSSVAFGGGGTVLYTASTVPLTVGNTTIASGTTTRILYDNAGVLGEYTLTGSGTAVAMGTSPVFTTGITTPQVLASANDSGALGASGTAFADLFLASGGVINWNAGNYTITHSAGLLTTNGNLSLTTSGVLTTGTIELGAASDTTLSRSGAGVLAVEGVDVLTTSGSQTVTNKTMTADTYGGASVISAAGTFDHTVPTADGTATGDVTTSFASGYATTAIGELVYLDSSQQWQKAKANSATTSGGVMMGIMLTGSATTGVTVKVALPGSMIYSTNYSAVTTGVVLYSSFTTAGGISTVQPVATDSVIRVVGHAIHAQKIFFNPSPDWITHT